jgi:hypothetical protein
MKIKNRIGNAYLIKNIYYNSYVAIKTFIGMGNPKKASLTDFIAN